jgi:aspartyl/glutamyl-tRNA(Asn/Gln) amidotransferase C subunit
MADIFKHSCMKLTDAQVLQVAMLAKLLSQEDPQFIAKYEDNMSKVLEYVSSVQGLNLDGVDFLDGLRSNHIEELREDIVDNSPEYKAVRKRIIANFPKKQGDLLLVPGIFN